MKRLSLCASLLLFAWSSPVLRATHLDDPGRLLPADAAWVKALDVRLDAFEHSSGIKVLVRIHAKSPSEQEDKEPGAYMRALATKLGVIRGGVLAVYFADDPDWRVWIGDELTPRFVGKPGTAKEFTESGAMHEAKEAFLKAVMAKADAVASPTPAPRVARQTDALVDGLIERLRARE